MSKDWPVNQDICLSTFLFGLVHRPQRLHLSVSNSIIPSLTNETPRYLNSSDWGRTSPQSRAWWTQVVNQNQNTFINTFSNPHGKCEHTEDVSQAVSDSLTLNHRLKQNKYPVRPGIFSLYSSAQTLLFSNVHVCKEKQPVCCAPTFPVSPLVWAFDTKHFGKKSAMPADERSCSVNTPITDQSYSVDTPQALKLWTALWTNDSNSHVVWRRYSLALKYLRRRHLPDL